MKENAAAARCKEEKKKEMETESSPRFLAP